MKFLKNDVVLLLGFLLLFCFGLSFLRNDSEYVLVSSSRPKLEQDCLYDDDSEMQEPEQELATSYEIVEKKVHHDATVPYQVGHRNEQLSDLSTDQLILYMKPLFMTKSAAAIISFLKHIPAASVFRIVHAIVSDYKIHLPPRVKLRIIFAAAQRQKTAKQRYPFFDLVFSDKRLQKGAKPLLVKAVEAGYAHLVPDILSWAKQADIGDIAFEALFYAARHDDEDPEALRELFEAGVPVNPALSSELLSQLVESCCEGYSVVFLVNQLFADANYVSKKGTPLIKAVHQNKVSVILELLKVGANPRLRDEIFQKSPIQLAQETGDPQLEELLRGFKA
ncbi:hypothetical protein ACFLX2_00625 [Candidatus Dependentiae bacterium]